MRQPEQIAILGCPSFTSARAFFDPEQSGWRWRLEFSTGDLSQPSAATYASSRRALAVAQQVAADLDQTPAI